MQGVQQLLESAEVRDVLATAGLPFEQIERMGPFGGVVLQLQSIVQEGLNEVGRRHASHAQVLPAWAAAMHACVGAPTLRAWGWSSH